MAEEEEVEQTFSEHVNVWQDMLRECAAGADKGNVSQSVPSTLVLLGDKRCGKSQFLNKFSDRVTIPETPEYILDYSYINVRNKHIQDRTAILSRMGVWSLDDPAHADLAVKLCGPLSHTMYGICIDLSKPYAAVESLNKWLGVLQQINDQLLTRVPQHEQIDLKRAISKHIQFYVDPSKAPQEGGGDEEEREEKKTISGIGSTQPVDDGPDVTVVEAEVEIDMTVPANNLGVPLFIVGLKSDHFTRMSKAGADPKFEYLAQQLRKISLQWGATLVFTSAVGDGLNIEVLQDYIFHRVFGFPLKESPKVVGTAEDYGLFVPSGYDSAVLVESAGNSTYKDGTPMKDVFEAAEAAKEKKADELIKAEASEDFYRSLKAQLSSGSATTASPQKKGGAKAVKSFFKNLLDGSGSKESRDQAQEALADMNAGT